MKFEFATAQRIVFGRGTLAHAGSIAAGFGARALVVMGSSVERVQPLLDALAASQVHTVLFHVSGEPTIALAQRGVETAQDAGCDHIISIGGGSVIDAGKAIAALCTNPGDVLDYLEVVGKAQPLRHALLPFVAIPTTAGSGSEATRNAVLTSPEHKVKVSLRSPLMLPKVALIDPELTFGLPPNVTAATGMDALAQVLEPFVSIRANPLTDALCREGMARAARSLQRAYSDGHDAGAREDMCVASLFGGMALANAGLGAVHGFAAPIGGMWAAPHGAVCARLLPLVFEANALALANRDPIHKMRPRFDEVARILTGNATATAADGAAWLRDVCAALHIPSLGTYGITDANVQLVVEKASAASSMQANPVKLTQAELADVLRAAL